MGANEEHDECKLEEVVENEMAPNTSGSLDIIIIVGEKVPDVSDLKEEENEPVDRGNHGIQCERCWVGFVLSPDGMGQVMLSILWYAKGVVDANENHKKPS